MAGPIRGGGEVKGPAVKNFLMFVCVTLVKKLLYFRRHIEISISFVQAASKVRGVRAIKKKLFLRLP